MPYFLDKLKNTPDGDGNLLDNTLIIYGSPMGNSNVHNHKRCPLFLAGHAGGALKGNLHLKAADGTPMANAMLARAAQARARDRAVRRQHGPLESERAPAPTHDGSRDAEHAANDRMLRAWCRATALIVAARPAHVRVRVSSTSARGPPAAATRAPVADAAMAQRRGRGARRC